MAKKNKKLSGFTLIEVIVVIAIIAILAGILIPVLIGYTRDAKANTLIANAKSVYSAAQLALNDAYKQGISHQGGEIFIGQNASDATADDGSVINVGKYMGEDFQGNYAFKLSSDGSSLECSVWSDGEISADEVQIYSHDEIVQSVSSKGIGSYPFIE